MAPQAITAPPLPAPPSASTPGRPWLSTENCLKGDTTMPHLLGWLLPEKQGKQALVRTWRNASTCPVDGNAKQCSPSTAQGADSPKITTRAAIPSSHPTSGCMSTRTDSETSERSLHTMLTATAFPIAKRWRRAEDTQMAGWTNVVYTHNDSFPAFTRKGTLARADHGWTLRT